jgi:hypothetical protein
MIGKTTEQVNLQLLNEVHIFRHRSWPTYSHREWSLGHGHLGPDCVQIADGPGPPMATENGRWDVVLFRYAMLGRELKTIELRTCFQAHDTY